MPTLDDYKLTSLATLGYSSGALNDREVAWLKGEGGTGTAYNDLWQQVLTIAGFSTGNFNDDMYAFLGSLGYTGALQDRLLQYWAAGGDVTANRVDSSGNFRVTSAGDYRVTA